MRSSKLAALLLVMSLCVTSCAGFTPPPNLNSQGQAAFRNTQAIKVLDLIRDTAIDANAQTPPLVSTTTTRKIVTFHQASIKIIDATTTGWAATVYHNLEDLKKDTANEDKGVLSSYYDFALNTLKGWF